MVSAATGTATIVLSYHLTAQAGHLPPGSTTPPISFLGAKQPEHTAYQIGFGLTGLLMGWCLHIWSRVILPELQSDGFELCASVAKWGGWTACFGACGQGLITLEPEIVEKLGMLGRAEISPQNGVHQLIALFFFVGAAVHCYSMTYALVCCNRESRLRQLSGPSSRALKLVVCAGTFLSAPVAEVLHPAARLSIGGARKMDIAGLAQYLTVGLYIAYFGLYSLDLLCYSRCSPQIKTAKD
eukprot:TRINITY_DN28497_c0_g1_i1.p1 TRINITY_DN28497_c0_g1~~TRINITY_DN28497_c0_g1_i1.p1  ORF type:complete len:241 (+),score=30.82 TRINITY_DN28497_c0_g1_i1:218-940(+)